MSNLNINVFDAPKVTDATTQAARERITDLATVRDYANITASDTSLDAAIQFLIDKVEDAIRSDLGFNPTRRNHVNEYHNGNGNDRILLRHRPVYSISDLREDTGGYYGKGTGAFPASSKLTEGSDFALQLDHEDVEGNMASISGIVTKLSFGKSATGVARAVPAGIWHPAVGSIQVSYAAGWTRNGIPQDIVLAATIGVKHFLDKLRQNKRGAPSDAAIQSISLGDFSVSYAADGFVVAEATNPRYLPNAARALLQRWRKVAL